MTKQRKKPKPRNHPITIGNDTVEPGQRQRIELPVARLFTQTMVSLPIEVVNGVQPGPNVWISAALHGDELNGVEIIHRVLGRIRTERLSGAIIAVPVVNVFGFLQRSRYLPDGRDLNRCFPGLTQGSLASRIAKLFVDDVVSRCDYGIDLHTAGGFRTNLPQVRANLTNETTRNIAEAFGAPCMIHGEAPRGSLRGHCARRGIPIIVYEAGEPHRFNPEAIRVGVRGVWRVLASLKMVRRKLPTITTLEATKRTWIRARRSGILKLNVELGDEVQDGQELGEIHDAFGDQHTNLMSPADGLVIGHTNHPLVNQGDAIIHLAKEVVRCR